MLKKSILISALAAMFLVSGAATAAMNHGGGGDHGRKGGDKDGACRKLKISHIEPADKSKLKPEGEFTFWVSGVNDLDWVEATAKKLPVKLTHKLVTNYYLFTGALPAELKGSAARIHITINSKKCPKDKGVLYFIDRD